MANHVAMIRLEAILPVLRDLEDWTVEFTRVGRD